MGFEENIARRIEAGPEFGHENNPEEVHYLKKGKINGPESDKAMLEEMGIVLGAYSGDEHAFYDCKVPESAYKKLSEKSDWFEEYPKKTDEVEPRPMEKSQ